MTGPATPPIDLPALLADIAETCGDDSVIVDLCRADLDAIARPQPDPRDAEIADLRAKLAGARTAYKMAEEHATQMRVERDAAEAKLTDLTRRRDAEQSCTAPSTCVHGVHLRDECDQCLAFNEGVAFGRRSAAVDMEALIAADAKVAALAADAARLTKPGPASDEELRRVYQRVDVTPGSGMRHDAGLRAVYALGLAHGRAEQAAAPAPDATDEEIAMAVDGYLRSHRGWGEGHGHRSDLTAAIARVVRPMLRAAESRAQRAEQERDEARDLAEQQYRVGRANAVDEMAKRAEWRKVNAGIEALAQCCNARERTDRICELRILIEQYAIDGRALAERAIAAAAQEIDRLRTHAKVAAVVEAVWNVVRDIQHEEVALSAEAHRLNVANGSIEQIRHNDSRAQALGYVNRKLRAALTVIAGKEG